LAVMETREVPSWRWGSTLGAGSVAGLLDAADATNDCVLALMQAGQMERQAETAWQRSVRDLDGEGPRRQAATHAINLAGSEYSDRLLLVYAEHALHFARLAAIALTMQVSGGAATSGMDPVLRTSRLYADPTLLPAPPTVHPDAAGRPVGAEVVQAHQRVLDAVKLGRTITDGQKLDQVDPGAPDDDTFGSWGMGLADLAEALHDYGHLCLWEVAGRSQVNAGRPRRD
jgi:hypothetical protein